MKPIYFHTRDSRKYHKKYKNMNLQYKQPSTWKMFVYRNNPSFSPHDTYLPSVSDVAA